MIAGIAKGHKLKTPKGTNTRPTTDRVKESLFNIIASYIEDANVLDMYAGTGSLGIEALSRGAKAAVFIDKSAECVSLIKDNLNHTKFLENADILLGDAEATVRKLIEKKQKFDLIFLDPPYGKNLVNDALKLIEIGGLLSEKGLIVAEHDKDDIVNDTETIKCARNQKYGDTVLTFLKNKLASF